jgi:hypothetical protein
VTLALVIQNEHRASTDDCNPRGGTRHPCAGVGDMIVLDVKLKDDEAIAVNEDNSIVLVLGVEQWREMGGPKQISVIIAGMSGELDVPSPRPPLGGMTL